MTSVLVIGRSHTACLKKAAREASDPAVKVINLNVEGEDPVAEVAKTRDRDAPLLLALSFQGNTHNILCLGEHPQKMTIAGIPVDDEERVSIPYSVFRDVLRVKIKDRMVDFIEEHRTAFPDAKIVVVLPPPPLAEVRQHPGISEVLAEALKQGVMPTEIRRAAYECQNEVYREIATALNVICLDPPVAALDDDGLLGRPFGSNDPTHANEAYGTLVIKQLKELARVETR